MAFCRVERNTVLRCLCLAAVLAVLAGDVATLAYGYHRGLSPEGQAGGCSGLELLKGGAVLCSALLLLALGSLLPERSSALCQQWLGMLVTYGDDMARHAVLMLFRLQVSPVLEAVGLTAYAADLPTLDYWWWCLQGLLLVALTLCLASSFSPSEEEFEEEVPEVVVGCGRLGREVEGRVDLPDLLALCQGPDAVALAIE